MTKCYDSRMGILFGFFGVLVLLISLILASFFTQNFNPLIDTVSSLGYKNAKFFFSVGFVIAGASGIPFVIYLDREFVDFGIILRKFAYCLAIFTNICISLVGIIPDESYINIFLIFHGFVASVAFGGTTIYIILYSILIYKHAKSDKYKKFKEYLALHGFSVGIILIIFCITIQPIIEWILILTIITWVMITAIQCIKFHEK